MFRKNTAGQFIHVQGIDASTGGIKSGVSWTVRRCIDGTFAAATGTATEDGTTGWYKFALSQADTNGNNIGFNFTGTGAVPQTVNILTDGSPPDVNLKNAAGTAVTLDANNVLNVSAKYLAGTALTGRDIGASVLLSSGTGAGQIVLNSGVADARLADAVSHGGTLGSSTATLALSRLNVTSQTANTSAVTATGNGTGAGIVATSGSGATGDGIQATAASTNGNGINATGNGTGAGMLATGGATGAGLKGVGGATSGAGIHGLGNSNGTAGILGASNGIGAGSDGIRGAKGASGTYDIGPVTVTTNNDKTGYAMTSAYDFAKGTTAMTESYAANGAAPTPVQAIMGIHQHLMQFAISGTSYTVKKLDNATTAYVGTLDDATSPSGLVRT